MDTACILENGGMKIMYIFLKVEGKKIMGERKTKSLKHVFALYNLPVIF